MANVLNTRLRLKYDALSEWVKVENTFIPLQGEVCIIDVPAQTDAGGNIIHSPAVLFKVGDGTSTFANLPYVSALAGDVPAWAKRIKKADGKTDIAADAFATALADIENLKAFFESEDGSGETVNILDKLTKLETTVGVHTETLTDYKARIEALEAIDHTAYIAADAALKTELQKEIDADVKVVADDLAEYEAANDAALASVRETADKAAVKADVDQALANRYTKTEVDNKLTAYTTTELQGIIDAEQDRRLGVIEADYVKSADIANFETTENVQKIADDLASYEQANDAALAEVKATAEAATTVEEVNSQIDTKITALNLDGKYEGIGAENRAKAYVDQKFTDADLDQYTTEQEVKDIVDGVIAGAADSETYNSLTKLVDYIDKHGGDATNMATAIETLEGQVDALEKAPAAGIKPTDIDAWNTEIGAKALAETKTTTAEVKAQIEAYGYATTDYVDGKASAAQTAAEKKASEDLAAAKITISAEIDADVKVVADDLTAYKTSNDGRVSKVESDIAGLATVATTGSAYSLVEVEKDINKTTDGDVEVDCFILYGGTATELIKNYNN